MRFFKSQHKEDKDGTPNPPTQEVQLASSGDAATSTAATAAPTKFGRHRRELEELLLKLSLIEKECVQQKLEDEKEVMKDEFIALKRETYKELQEINELIRSRHQIQRKQGNTVEVIQKGATLKRNFEHIDARFARMKDVFKAQVRLRGKKFTDEQLDQRFNELQVIKQQIESARNIFQNGGLFSDAQVKTLTDFQGQMKKQGLSFPNTQTQHEWRELTHEEQQALDRWRERDADIDRQVAQIGDAVDRLAEIAVQIGEKTEQQSQLVAKLHEQADDANAELLAVNDTIKEILKKQGGMNLMCKFMLALTLVGLLAYIIPTIRARIIG